jgi:hypothetical protein
MLFVLVRTGWVSAISSYIGSLPIFEIRRNYSREQYQQCHSIRCGDVETQSRGPDRVPQQPNIIGSPPESANSDYFLKCITIIAGRNGPEAVIIV